MPKKKKTIMNATVMLDGWGVDSIYNLGTVQYQLITPDKWQVLSHQHRCSEGRCHCSLRSQLMDTGGEGENQTVSCGAIAENNGLFLSK